MKRIPLFNSTKYALVDDADYELVNKYSWVNLIPKKLQMKLLKTMWQE